MSYAVYAYVTALGAQDKIGAQELNWTGTWSPSGTYSPTTYDSALYNDDRFIAILSNVGVNPTAVLPNRQPNPWSQLVIYQSGDEPPFVPPSNPGDIETALETAWVGTALAGTALQTAWVGTALAEAAYELAGTSQSNQLAYLALTTAWAGTAEAYVALTTAWTGTEPTNAFTVGETAQSAGTIVVDFAGSRFQQADLTGDATFISANRAVGEGVSARIDPFGADRNLYFHPSWKFLGGNPDIPTQLFDGQVAMLSLTSFGPDETDVIAVYSSST